MNKKDMNMPSNDFTTGSTVLLAMGGVLTAIFLVLKLTGLITWSYWKVFLPLLIAISIPLSVFIGIGVMMLCLWLLAILLSK